MDSEIKDSRFAQALDSILKDVKPHERECRWATKSPYCEKRFYITKNDINFYYKLQVPPPTLCPTCRRIRRWGFTGTFRLHKTQCTAPNHNENIISVVSPGTPFKIYDWDYYRTYEWEPLSYGRNPNADQSIFDALWNMRQEVPQFSLVKDPSNVESDFTLNGRNLKRAYFVSGGWNSERIYYSDTVNGCRDCVDCYSIQKATNCYECTFSRSLNDCDFLYFSNDCYSCRSMYDSRNCHDCFGCVNLRNQSYCFFNEQLTKEDYKKRISEIDMGDRNELLKYQKRFWELVKSLPVRATRNELSQNSTGNHIVESRNCHEAYVTEKCENVRFADKTIGNKDSMDYSVSGSSELLYETNRVGSKCSNVKFSFFSKFVTDSEFVINCRNISNCFGCIGLENQSYCIFNKKYEPEEYKRKVDEIKTKMLERGEYGEFFPFKFSSYAYQDSIAQVIFPLTKEQIEALGSYWYDPAQYDSPYEKSEALFKKDIPVNIKDVSDDILSKALICEITDRPFRIISEELEFYRRKRLPLPTIHPNERIKQRYTFTDPYRLHDELCGRCGIDIKSMYQSKDGYRPYCEQCYQAEVV